VSEVVDLRHQAEVVEVEEVAVVVDLVELVERWLDQVVLALAAEPDKEQLAPEVAPQLVLVVAQQQVEPLVQEEAVGLVPGGRLELLEKTN
jgi:hypothetical protein